MVLVRPGPAKTEALPGCATLTAHTEYSEQPIGRGPLRSERSNCECDGGRGDRARRAFARRRSSSHVGRGACSPCALRAHRSPDPHHLRAGSRRRVRRAGPVVLDGLDAPGRRRRREPRARPGLRARRSPGRAGRQALRPGLGRDEPDHRAGVRPASAAGVDKDTGDLRRAPLPATRLASHIVQHAQHPADGLRRRRGFAADGPAHGNQGGAPLPAGPRSRSPDWSPPSC